MELFIFLIKRGLFRTFLYFQVEVKNVLFRIRGSQAIDLFTKSRCFPVPGKA